MTTAIQTSKPKTNEVAKPSALNIMASRVSCDPLKLLATLKATAFRGATDDELFALVIVSNEYQLNPLLKEMYAFPAKGGGIVPIVSVDGWNKMLIRHEQFDGIEFDFTESEEGELISCTATVYVKNRSKPVKITEYFAECQRNTDNWKNMPHRMLRNRTLCQASRMAFGFSGLHNEEEVEAIGVESVVTVLPSELPPKMIAPANDKQSTPQQQLEVMVLGAGHDFTTLQNWMVNEEFYAAAGSIGSFDEIPTDETKRLLKAEKGLLMGLKAIKGEA